MATDSNENPHRNRAALVGLAALFFVPLMGAFWLYYAGGWRPAGSTNNGELITPIVTLSAAPVRDLDGAPLRENWLLGKWTLVYVTDTACDERCREALWTIRQTRLLLVDDVDRVQRLLLTRECCDRQFLAAEHPGLEVGQLDDETARNWAAQFPRVEGVPYIYIVDPLGNLMMRFDSRETPKGLLEDLKKLLKLSHIG
jgi:cytochrome oxidase Cu insertion factor (SCO1/SenC/PrrC family)